MDMYYDLKKVKSIKNNNDNIVVTGKYSNTVKEGLKSFIMLRSIIQDQIDKVNMDCIDNAVKEGKRIFVDPNVKDLIVSRAKHHYNCVDHYIMFRNTRIQIRSSANLSFNNRYMDKIDHVYIDGNYIYSNQISMTNVINYMTNRGIQYYHYNPQDIADDDIYIGCETTKVP